jgi:transglutaminase 1
MSWAYHQFDPDVLDAVLLLLDTAQASYALSDPIWVSRHLTNVLSATTDRNVNGVLHGKWPSADEEDPYKDGKSPTAWTGSRMIFSQWLKDQKTVKYGQCWVFAGILTSALRTIGIPSRSLTTFRSAHDTRYESETNDYDHIIHYQTESESIWNFHVWVRIYISLSTQHTHTRTHNTHTHIYIYRSMLGCHEQI